MQGGRHLHLAEHQTEAVQEVGVVVWRMKRQSPGWCAGLRLRQALRWRPWQQEPGPHLRAACQGPWLHT
jgi:hypothetical protein